MGFTNFLPGEPECQWVQPGQCGDHHLHTHTHTHTNTNTYQLVLHLHQQYSLLVITQVPPLSVPTPLLVMVLAQMAPPFLLNIST
jgi:hypothetical protein